jgi:mannose-6-phosphate isomerase
LSIQAHPSLEQARAGFARANAAGIPLDASHRNYRDDNHKPELIVALTPFVALEGFRPPAEIAHRITALGLTDLQTQASTLATTSDLQPFFAAVMTLSEGARRRVLRQLRLAVTSEPGLQAHWIRILLDRHPDDIGALAPVLLHVVVLRPGQALFLPAGELHAYLEGAGLELMANSDNVLRGGLTPKHIDVPELLRILRFEPSAPAILEPQPGSAGCFVYSTPASEFELAYVDATREPVALPGTAGSIRVALCTEGSVELLAAGDPPLVLERGRCAMVSGRAADPQICGTGRVWLAGVP